MRYNELKAKLFELPEVKLFGFKLNEVSFLFDEYYKEKVMPQVSEIHSNENADVYLFRKTSIEELNEDTYYLKLSLFYDTVVVRRKKPVIVGNKIVVDTWYNIVKKEAEKTLHIPFSKILSAYEKGIIIFEFDRDKEELFILETRLNNISKLIPFNP